MDSYVVKNADGSDPEWPWFVLGADSPAAVAGMIAYADAAERFGASPDEIARARAKAQEFDAWRNANVAKPSASQPIEGRGA